MQELSSGFKRLSKHFFVFGSIFFLSCASIYAQDDIESEIEDNTSVPAEQYLIKGEKVTFSTNPSDFELAMIGSWESNKGSVKRIQFADSETVIVTFADKQMKGNWFLNDKIVSIQLKQNELNSSDDELSGLIVESNKVVTLELKGHGSFVKSN
ncbi:MAG: hypothetical protein K9G41_12935 [Flavobacteriales bacterium]|nr:hypothetical protein [Flavobacteriales bacterium]